MTLCRSQGFAGPSACVLDAGHSGPHKYGDIATALAERQRKDAERYRWLRGDGCQNHSRRWTQFEVRRWKAPMWTADMRGEELDDAIDVHMRAEI